MGELVWVRLIMGLVGVQSVDVWKEWDSCQPFFERPIKESNGSYTRAALQNACEDRDAQLWKIEDDGEIVGAAITEVRDARSGLRSVHVIMMGANEMMLANGCQDDLVEWAKSIGAKKLTAECRPGLPSKLNGWRRASVVMEKDIG